MPSGIPPTISALAESLQQQVTDFVTYLQIPSYSDTSHHLKIAFSDSIKAWKSIFHFVLLTCRPIVILLALISRYLLILLKILSEHTIYHGILAGKESWRQLKIAVVWLIAFQKSLSRTVIYMEIGFVFVCIGLYMIRRYIKRKKYFQRLGKWYGSKKRNVQLKYNNFVDTVAQTSLILALLLPHILYMTMTLLLKYFAPSIINYLATNTILSDVISFYIPFFKTIVVLFKYKNYCTFGDAERKENISSTRVKENAKGNEATDNTKSSGFFPFLRKSNSKSTKVSVADAYNKAASTSKHTKNMGISSQKTKKATTQQKSSTLNPDELDEISQEAAEWIKYWTVYAILTACIQTATLVPILGRIFYNANPINAKKAAASVSRWSRGNNRTSILDKIKLSTTLLEECKLFFFAWLRLLPTSLTSSSRNGSYEHDVDKKKEVGHHSKQKTAVTDGVKNRIKALDKQAKISTSNQKSTSIRRKQLKTNYKKPFSNQPLDIMYEKVAPIAISLVSISTNAVNSTNNHTDDNEVGSTAIQSIKNKCITFGQTFLTAMVWTKMISESTKNLIENTFSQCKSLLPGAITLMMPSYFTTYGVIYVRWIVPCANSSSVYNEFKKLEGENIMHDNGFIDSTWIDNSFAIIQYLQYWTIQVVLSSILSSFSSILAWVPFSTHMIWLLWAYVQLEANTKKIYNLLEWELIAFGILKVDPSLSTDQGKLSGSGVRKSTDLNETMTMQLVNNIMKRVPSSNLSTTDAIEKEKESKGSETKEVLNDEKTMQKIEEEKGSEDKSQSKQTISGAINEEKQLKETRDNPKPKPSSNNVSTTISMGKDKEVTSKTESITEIVAQKKSASTADDSNKSDSSDDNDYVCISSEARK